MFFAIGKEVIMRSAITPNAAVFVCRSVDADLSVTHSLTLSVSVSQSIGVTSQSKTSVDRQLVRRHRSPKTIRHGGWERWEEEKRAGADCWTAANTMSISEFQRSNYQEVGQLTGLSIGWLPYRGAIATKRSEQGRHRIQPSLFAKLAHMSGLFPLPVSPQKRFFLDGYLRWRLFCFRFLRDRTPSGACLPSSSRSIVFLSVFTCSS